MPTVTLEFVNSTIGEQLNVIVRKGNTYYVGLGGTFSLTKLGYAYLNWIEVSIK